MREPEDLLDELNTVDEHQQIEAKTVSDNLGESILGTISAFSNEPDLDGGYIILGVARDSKTNKYHPAGVNNPDKIQTELVSACANRFSINIRPEITAKDVNGKTVIVVYIREVSPSLKPVTFERKTGGKTHQKIRTVAYRRIGSSDVLCTREDYDEFVSLKQNRPYDETLLPGVSLSDINPGAIAEYRRLRKEYDPSASELAFPDSDLLVSLHCAERKDDVVIPTIAGLILFGTNSVLRRFFPLTRIDYIRTKTRQHREFSDEDSYYTLEFREAVFTMFPKVEAAIMGNIEREMIFSPDKLTREERPVIPYKAVREALVNAVMHRDYRQNGPTTIIQYPDRIEFFNHGHSLKPVGTYGEYGNSKTRNPEIAAVLHETQYAENKGTGIPKIWNYLKKANLEEPHFVSDKDTNTFSVTFYLHQLEDDEEKRWLSQFTSLDLTPEELRILVFAHKNRTVSNELGRDVTGLDTIHVSRLLTGLRKKGILVSHSAGPKTHYSISDEWIQGSGRSQDRSPLDPMINPLDPMINPLDTKMSDSGEAA